MPKHELRESEDVEFKERWTDKALEDLAAFSNHRGGVLYVGVSDDGEVMGLSGNDEELRHITSKIHDVLGITPALEWQNHDGRQILVVCVHRSAMLVPLRGRYLKRMGSTNRQLSQDEFADQILRRMGLTWDALPSDAGIEEVDPQALRQFAGLAKKRYPHLDSDHPADSVLDKLGLTKDGRVTNAALLLFGRNPQRHFFSAQCRMAKLEDGEILDERIADGTLFDQLETLDEGLRSYLQVRYEITGKGRGLEAMQRDEVWEYPYLALREALVNALIHRDYTASGDIQVRVYDDRLEIWNPGGLPEDMDPTLLRMDPHPSRRRNERLAHVFHMAGMIERWGTGTLRMINACRTRDLPEPEFIAEGGGFRVVFRKNLYTPDQLAKLDLNERQIQAILEVKRTASISNEEYQQLAGTTKRTASRDLANLVERNIFERIGETGRGTRYRLLQSTGDKRD